MQYHYAIHSLLKYIIGIQNMKIAEAIALNNDRELSNETRKMNKSNNTLPRMMDKHSGADDVSNIFSNEYSNLYNSEGYNMDNMNTLKADIKK